VINHSGGKDSQAMFLKLRDLIPKQNLVVIHAHLPEVEWDGTIEHIKNTIGHAELHVVQAGKTFFEMVEHRQMWPPLATASVPAT
jgi:tRNA(Ile)-lysidine synthase TilS/MesJ